MTYSVYCPDFSVTSGGIRVMWGLWAHLMAKGQIALPGVQNMDVAIYPEIVNGNPLNGNKVVRYILQKPGLMASYGVPGPTTFDPTDEIYVFSRIYDQWGVDDDHVLFLPIIDLHTFDHQGKIRTKTAFYCARGENLNKHPKDAIEITREFAANQQALADLLNECSVLYVYDRITAMLEVARLCGCPIEYWGESTSKDFGVYEPGINGISWRGELYEFSAKDFREHYKGLIHTFSERLDKFIEHTQS